MAFNEVGLYWLKNGKSVRAEITYGFGEDHGAQWIMAHPEINKLSYPQAGHASFVVNDFTKTCDWSPDTGQFYYNYWVTIRNDGIDTYFSLQGGGNI
ncbi:hypothetical protein [Cupriavidus sp. BIS7]|uniref:hypothetical protein n=1 Tax=Cupriavidus sp. BIS7 TaxID=1217718 RepID=UPI0012F6CC63|nr:hypothetical protein [Cupriavidus sp. BIS7]